MKLHTKLFIQTTVILVSVFVIGGYGYISNLENLLKAKEQSSINSDIKKIDSYLQTIETELLDEVQKTRALPSIQASLNLISKYQQKKRYQKEIFDVEKFKVLQIFDKYEHYSVEVFDKDNELIVYKNYLDNRQSGIVSYNKNGERFYLNTQKKQIPFPKINAQEIKTSKISTSYLQSGHYKICYSRDIIANMLKVGTVRFCYFIGQKDLQKINENTVYPIYLQVHKNKIQDESILQRLKTSYLEKTVVYPHDPNLYAFHVVDENVLQSDKNAALQAIVEFALIIVIIAFFISWFYSKKLIVRPLLELKESIQSIKNKKFKRARMLANDEFGDIMSDFNDVFEQLLLSDSYNKAYKDSIDNANLVSTTNLKGTITSVNKAFQKISGYSEEELVGSAHNIVRHEDMPKEVFKELWDTIQDGKIWKGIVKNKRKDGDYYWTDAVITPVFGSDNTILEYLSIRRDITELMDQKDKLYDMLNYDELTKLGSRNKLENDLKTIKNPRLALINIDSFSQVNDFYGHIFGDKILQKFGEKINTLASEIFDDVLCYRQSGDEFILLSNSISKDEFIQNVEKVLEAIELQSFVIEEESVDLTVSCGISFENTQTLRLTADMALRVSKKEKEPYTVYSAENSLNKTYQDNIMWAKRLKSAIHDDRVVPFFQPIVNNKTMQYDKFEALVRLKDLDNKPISPFFFLEVAKQTKQYLTLTKIMLEKTFERFSATDKEFSINLTVEDTLNNSIKKTIQALLDKYENIGPRVVFELVESESIDKSFDEVLDFINNVKRRGCKIAIDDFGTGYSNFEYLIKLRADYIKIDGSLIKNILINKEAHILVSIVIEFAQRTGIKTIAEFVENEEILNELLAMGVDYSQGYYFSAPNEKIINENE